MTVMTADLGVTLADLWDADRCIWRVDFDAAAGTDSPWIVVLEWMDEYRNPHHADWATYTWHFYGETIEEALRDAVEWCESLLPFERCGACDGDGEYGVAGARVKCEECGGIGLANPPVVGGPGSRDEDGGSE